MIRGDGSFRESGGSNCLFPDNGDGGACPRLRTLSEDPLRVLSGSGNVLGLGRAGVECSRLERNRGKEDAGGS